MPIIPHNMAKNEANGVLRFIIKSQKWYNIFCGTNEAQWKIPLCSMITKQNKF